LPANNQKLKPEMKKSLTIAAFAGMLAFVACGPSEEEKKAMEQKKQDSIQMVEKAKADSLANAMQMQMEQAKQDSMKMAMEKMKADSIAKAEEGAKKKGGKK
jgi:hypothetical protein